MEKINIISQKTGSGLRRTRRFLAFFLAFVIAFNLIPPLDAQAADNTKVVIITDKEIPLQMEDYMSDEIVDLMPCKNADGKYQYECYPVFDWTDYASFDLRIKEFGNAAGDYISIKNGDANETLNFHSGEGKWQQIGETLYAMPEWLGETLQIAFDLDLDDSVDAIYIQLGTATAEKAKLTFTETTGGKIDVDDGTQLGETSNCRYTVTASANPGYEYDGYTLTTSSEGSKRVPWDWETVGYNYSTKEKPTNEVKGLGDTRASTATFDITITEDADLKFHFKKMEPEKFFEGVQPSLFKGTEETRASLTRSYSPKDQVPVKSYKAGDWAYINFFVPLHGTISYEASKEPVKITVYEGNGTTGGVLFYRSNKFATGGSGEYSYPNSSHPYNNSGEVNGLSLNLRLQLPESDWITAVVEWPYFNQTWTLPIKVMDINNQYVGQLRDEYNRLATTSGYDPFRYYLKTVYEDESAALLEMDETEQESYITQALAHVRDAAEGKGADAVVWRFRGKGHGSERLDSLPILVAVPPDTTNAHNSMVAALEAAFPGNWTYKWTSGGFGPIVAEVTWGDPDLDKGEVICNGIGNFEYGNYGSFFNDRDGYSQVGVGGYPAVDGSIMAWNSSATLDQWHYALLRRYWNHDDDALAKALAAKGTTVDAAIKLPTSELEKLFADVDLDGNKINDDDFRRYGQFKDETPASEVMRLIAAIGSVGPYSGDAIRKARAAYKALSAEEKAKVKNLAVLEAAEETYRKLMASIGDGESSNWTEALTSALTAFQNPYSPPVVGSVGGEWRVVAVARNQNQKIDLNADPEVSETTFAKNYRRELDRALSGNGGLPGLDTTGLQHTEYSRIVLALSSLGLDAHPYVAADGTPYDFLPYLVEDTTAVINQGTNGPIFALLALDSKPYDDKDAMAAKDKYISAILTAQLDDGGWSVGSSSMDTDMTAMAVQALAPYYSSNLNVQKAVNRALTVLRQRQSEQGGFYSNGVYNSESVSQVIVALTALAYHTSSGSLPESGTWKVCGTEFKNPLTALMTFAVKDEKDAFTGSFGHTIGDDDRMATEQAAYALVAYGRFTRNDTSLYTMRDFFEGGSAAGSVDVKAAQKLVYEAFEGKLGWLQPSDPHDLSVTKEEIEKRLPKLPDGVTAIITVNRDVAPKHGTVSAPNGEDGEVTFSVALSSGSVTLTVAFGKSFPAEKYVSDDYGLRSVAVKDKAGLLPEEGTTIMVTLEQELVAYNTFSSLDFLITPRDSDATVSELERDGFNWTFYIIAADGKSRGPDYTIQVVGSDSPKEIAQANVDAAATILKMAGDETLPADIQSEETIAEWVQSLIPDAISVEKTVKTEITAPVDGTKDDPNGTPGEAKITVTLTTDYQANAEQSAGMETDDDGDEALLKEATAKLAEAKAMAEEALTDIPQTTDEDTLRSWAQEKLEAVNWDSDISYQVTVNIDPPVDGSEDAPDGTPGKITFVVDLSCAAGEVVVSDYIVVEQALPAQPYVQPEPKDEPVPEDPDEPQPDGSEDNDDGSDTSGDEDADEPNPGGEDSGTDDSNGAASIENPDGVLLSAAGFLYNDGPEGVKSITETVTITVKIPAKPYVASNNTKLASVVHNNQMLTPDGHNYKLELPTGETFNTAWLVITPIDTDATVSPLSSEGNGLWNFTVTAANKKDTETYSLLVTSVSGTIEENREAVNTAWAKINAIDSWTVPMETVNNSETGVNIYIRTRISNLVGSISYSIVIDEFKQAVEGSKETPKGTDGSFTATITLSKGIPGSSTYVEEAVTIEGTITAKEYEAKPEGEITVWFTLLGDTDHGDPGTTNTHTLAGRNLDTWIPTQELTVPAGSTVGYVFSMVLDEWGYSYVGLEGNYIKTIITPRGLSLSEFTNGKLSGWMYTVNGEHPNQGLNKWTLNDKDEIIWHYTDDYTKERGGTGNSNANGSAELTPTAIVRNGTASAAVTEEELNAAVDAAIKDRLSTILIAPVGTERADSLSVDLPTTSLYDAARNGIGVTVESTTGSVVVPGDALSGIVRTARGSDVTITTSVLNSYEAERLLEGEELEEEQLTSSSVTEVTISSGRTAITSWGGRSITLSLPVDSRNFEARERYTVYQISENGSIEEHTGRCVRSGGALFVEVDVTHLSTFVVVPTAAETADEEKAPEALPTNVYLPFVDTANHWALDSIGYVYQKGLMRGTGAYNFQPNISMSRAMFVTVLHRLEGTPASTGVNVYSDVVPSSWYTDAVTWATSAGIVNGTGEGKFSPNASISREEMATMMMRYAKYKNCDTAATTDLAGYADANQIHDWAYRAMEWANSTGMITGRTAFTLVPQGTATRAETATILVRFIQKFMPSKY